MNDLSELFGWTLLVGVLLLASVLRSDRARRLLAPHAQRAWLWMSEHLRPEEELDPVLEAVLAARRREQLCGHVERLRRVIATDEHMSATRQIGNRLAYASLLCDLAETPEVVLPVHTAAPPYREAMVRRWDPAERPGDDVGLAVGEGVRHAPRVEVLELGWGR